MIAFNIIFSYNINYMINEFMRWYRFIYMFWCKRGLALVLALACYSSHSLSIPYLICMWATCWRQDSDDSVTWPVIMFETVLNSMNYRRWTLKSMLATEPKTVLLFSAITIEFSEATTFQLGHLEVRSTFLSNLSYVKLYLVVK